MMWRCSDDPRGISSMAVDDINPDSSQLDSAALEAAVERFESAWSEDGAPLLDEFLAGTGPRRGALLRELVAVDLEYRLKRGELVRVEAYLQRFPELADDEAFCLQFVAHNCPVISRTMSIG